MRYRSGSITLSILASLGLTSTLSAFEWGTRVWLDYVFLEREKIHNKTLVIDDCITDITLVESYGGYCCPVIRNEVLDTKDLVENFDFRPGFSLGVELTPNLDTTYQFSLLYMTEWKAKEEVCGCFSLVFPFYDRCYTNDFVDADKVDASYTSRYWQIEANYFGNLTYRNANYFAFAAIMGLRYINLREHFDLAFTTCPCTSNYTISTDNDLYGVQIGGNLQINPMPKLSFETQLKAGYLVNWCGQHTFLGDDCNTCVLRDFSAHKYTGSWLVDFNALMRYQLFPFLDLHGGYQLIYLTDLALAPEQVDKHTCPINKTRVYDRGQIFLDGGFVGLGYSF